MFTTETKFQITSRAGLDMGEWEGETKAEALAKLHRDAGYQCTVDQDGDDVEFESESDAELAGYVGDWHFDKVA